MRSWYPSYEYSFCVLYEYSLCVLICVLIMCNTHEKKCEVCQNLFRNFVWEMFLQNFSCLILALVVLRDNLLQLYDAPCSVEKSADGEIWTRNLLLLRRCLYRGATRSDLPKRGSEVHIYWRNSVNCSSIVLKMYPKCMRVYLHTGIYGHMRLPLKLLLMAMPPTSKFVNFWMNAI